MRQWRRIGALGLAVCLWVFAAAGAYAQQVVEPEAFAQAYVRSLQEALPEREVTLLDEFTVAVTTESGEQAQLSLENAYAEYLAGEEDAQGVIDYYVSATLPALRGETAGFTREGIVAVLKDQAYLDYVLELGLDVAHETLLEGLYIIYMLDTPTAVRALGWDEVEALGVAREELRPLAVENLTGLLPPVEIVDYEGLLVFAADGMYDASLLLIGLPTAADLGFTGDMAIGVPARDLLVVADGGDPQAFALLQGAVSSVYQQSGYPISDRLIRQVADGYAWWEE